MSPSDRQHAHALLDRVPPDQIIAAVRFLEFLLLDPVARTVATAPADDEPVTAEDERRILSGQAALGRGEQGTPMEEVLADFGLSMEDFPLRQG